VIPVERSDEDIFMSRQTMREETTMARVKRLIVATLLGAVSGLFCYSAAILLLGLEIPFLNGVYIIISRILIGFVIGISALDLPWHKHGLLIGLIIGLPFALFDIIIGQEWYVASAAFIMGPVFGLCIEYFTTKVFKAPMVKSV
jgi:hypothetical protein